jgi:DNA-binding CsgD family transcriptional regulator
MNFRGPDNTPQAFSPRYKLSAGTVVAGVIAFVLGAVGLLQLYGRVMLPFDLAIVSVYLTTLGALLLFGAIAVIGLGLIIGGIATIDEPETVVVTPAPTVVREVVVNQPVPAVAAYPTLSELEVSILRLLSQGKTDAEMATATGVSTAIISEKVTKLYAEGYITEKRALTEKGFEAVQPARPPPVYARPG